MKHEYRVRTDCGDEHSVMAETAEEALELAIAVNRITEAMFDDGGEIIVEDEDGDRATRKGNITRY